MCITKVAFYNVVVLSLSKFVRLNCMSIHTYSSVVCASCVAHILTKTAQSKVVIFMGMTCPTDCLNCDETKLVCCFMLCEFDCIFVGMVAHIKKQYVVNYLCIAQYCCSQETAAQRRKALIKMTGPVNRASTMQWIFAIDRVFSIMGKPLIV